MSDKKKKPKNMKKVDGEDVRIGEIEFPPIENGTDLYYISNTDVYKYTSPHTGRPYRWERPERGKPAITEVEQEDLEDLLELKGNGCACHGAEPGRLFFTKELYEKEVLGKGRAKKTNKPKKK